MITKYELTDETVTAPDGTKLFRIRAMISFGTIVAGALGGFIASSANLSQDGNAWVYGDARVEVRISVATRSDGYTFLITPIDGGEVRIIAGCRYFTIAEARDHWTKTRVGTRLGDESLAIVDHLERVAQIRGWLQ